MTKTHAESLYRIDLNNKDTTELFIKIISDALGINYALDIGDDGKYVLKYLLDDLTKKHRKISEKSKNSKQNKRSNHE